MVNKLKTDPRYPLFTDMIAAAERRIPKRVAGYFISGADTEAGLAENMAAFQRMRLVPRYGIDVSNVETQVSVFGRTYGAPIGVAPVGYVSAIWPGAERALAAAAARANVPYVNSTYAIESIETIAAIAPGLAWFQLYYFRTMEDTLALAARAAKAGVDVLVLTIDIPVDSKRTRDHRNRLEFPPRVTPSLLWEVARCPAWAMEFLKHPYPVAGNVMPFARDPKGGERAMRELFETIKMRPLTWDEIGHIRKAWPGKFVLKGIQHPADAEEAVRCGADGIIVSNHGGRQLDAAPAPIDSLPLVAQAVDGRATLMLDSGIRSGLDVVKGLVRGASLTFAGRPFVAACAAMGNHAGPDYAMGLFRTEIAAALGQLGLRSATEAIGNRTIEFR